MIVVGRIERTRNPALALALCGLVGLWVTGLGARADAREALHGYLFAFLYWLSLSLGALFVLCMFHSTSARWPVVLRRPLEWMALSCLLFMPLFLPIAGWAGELFIWIHPTGELGEQATKLLAHKAPYLNRPFFLVRAALYFGVWGTLAYLLHRLSSKQDESKELHLVRRQRLWAAGSLPFLGITVSFAALDWIMSLEPLWSSTLFASYVFTGAVTAALATVIVLAVFSRTQLSFGTFMTASHFQRLGTLLLAFICLWAYCAYSQAMLIWIAGIPRESTWYLKRTQSGWGTVAAVIALGHFAVPLVLLLFRRFKQRPHALATLAAGLLLVHALDIYWMVLPALHPDGPHPHWTSLSALVGIGALTLGFGLWLAGEQYPLPVSEPYLVHSLKVPMR